MRKTRFEFVFLSLHDRIFRKDRLAAPERLVDRRFRARS